MAKLSAVRWDPTMKAHYRQLIPRGKLGKVALVACMRKLLGSANARRRKELQNESLALALSAYLMEISVLSRVARRRRI